MTLVPIILGYGLTIDEACFNFVTGDTYFVCSGFTSFSSQTIPYIIAEDSGNTLSVSSGYYSDGNMVRYFTSTGDTTGGVLCEAYLCNRSEYLRDCCNNKLYKLKSGKSLPVNALISVKPVYFCYRVVEKPRVPLQFDIINDTMGYLIFPSSYQCDAAECQPCDCITSGDTRNDCDPIILFPLEIKCDVTNPTEALPYSGKVSAIVIGGTQPYMYTWTLPDGRQVHTQTINNVTDGTYHLVVVDKYGDFTASTDCTISTYIDCTFSGSVTEIFPVTTTTTTIDYTCYCYVIENNYNGPLITTTTTINNVPGCQVYCIENFTQTGNGITDTFIFTYTDCYGNLTQRLLAQGNTALIYTLDISVYTVEWVDGVGTPPVRWTDFSINFGEGNCSNTIITRLGEIVVDYYDCFSGRTSMILPNGTIRICSYTMPTIYSSVTNVTITKDGLCQKQPCSVVTPTPTPTLSPGFIPSPTPTPTLSPGFIPSPTPTPTPVVTRTTTIRCPLVPIITQNYWQWNLYQCAGCACGAICDGFGNRIWECDQPVLITLYSDPLDNGIGQGLLYTNSSLTSEVAQGTYIQICYGALDGVYQYTSTGDPQIGATFTLICPSGCGC